METTTSETDLNDLTFKALIHNVNERKPTERDALILPVSTLPSYQNRLGNRDVQSPFTAYIEKGQAITDNGLDCYLSMPQNISYDNLKDSFILAFR